MESVIQTVNGIIWSEALVALCLAAGLYFSFATRFLQLRLIRQMIRLLFGTHETKRGVSSFQALALSISGRVGVGNIAGVATAIAYGGPGAIFWMWLIAFLGAGTAFIESSLAQAYKVDQDGEFRGGPAYFIDKALGWKKYAAVFAVSTIFAVGFFLPGVQANSIAVAVDSAFGLPAWLTGLVVALALGAIVIGGIHRIAHAAQVLVPIMAIVYILVALAIIAINWQKVPEVLSLIVSSAFALNAGFAGIVGAAISWGVKRGIYSNEAGQGTGPHAAAAAEVNHPAEQGLVQSFSVYIDTLFVCTATALMILLSGTYNVYNADGGFLIQNLGDVLVGPVFTQLAIDSSFSGFGQPFVAVALLLFAFTTLMAYYYIAETNVAYLGRNTRLSANKLIWLLRVLIIGSVFYGSTQTSSAAWALGDVGVGLMAWLNLFVIIILRKPAIALLKDYEAQLSSGESPRFSAKKFGIDDADHIWPHDVLDDRKERL